MIFSELGHIAEASWLAMLRVFPVITEPIWEIMPNHFHVLFFLNNTDKKEQKNDAQFGPLIPNSVSSIINHFKGRVTKYANNNQIGFSWQERFYDHIVRDEAEYQRIANYIIHNPKNWENDKFFS
jgi:putative transposase